MGQVHGPQIYGFLFDNPKLPITETMVNYWLVIVLVTGLCIFLTWRMEKIPSTKQAIAEKIVLMIDGLVDSTMGSDFHHYAPYIAALMISSIFGSFVSLIGLRPVTGDLNTTLGWALITFALITYNKIKYSGFLGYLKGFTEPIFLLAPLNVLGEASIPVSLSFRHFGNVGGGLVISMLVMSALGALSNALHLPLPLFQIGIPGALSLYFDVFSGCIQAFIFCMLTMVNVASAKD